MKASARPRCGATFPTGFNKRLAPACSSIRAPAMAPRLRSRRRGRSTTCIARRSTFCRSCSQRLGFRRGLLVLPSDGASIAAIYAGGVQDHRIRAIALIVPHFIVEGISVTSIAEIRTAYETTNLSEKLARWHRDVDNAFYGWNGAWLDPNFRNWDISEYLAYVRVPVAIIQGADDRYGTIRQGEIAQEECYCPVDVTIPEAGHCRIGKRRGRR